ncbi:hypothetical protein KBX46_11940 [Micromonospora sp. C81]|nr:hypothetical protein [Micromonospora sp. C81]
MRWGEASALRASRLDLLRRRVTLALAFAEVGGELVEGTPKNHQRRSVPIPRFLVDELAGHVAGRRREDLVFTAPNGGPLRNTNFRPRIFAAAAASVGLAGLTPHDLRHAARGTRRRVWLWRRAPTSRRCSGCSGTPRRR